MVQTPSGLGPETTGFSLHRECREFGLPSSYDRGEELRRVQLSATEGEDKPLKCPTIFNSRDIAMTPKPDFAAAVEFEEDAARRNIRAVCRDTEIFEVSAKSDEGMSDYLEYLERRRSGARAALV